MTSTSPRRTRGRSVPSSVGIQKPNRRKEKAERDAERERLHEEWREAVIEKGRTAVAFLQEPIHRDMYRCFHCRKLFAREMICADHWPFTKGSRPDLRYEVWNGVPSCQPCNTSGNPNRRMPDL